MRYLLLVVGLALVPFSSITAQETSKNVKEKLEITIKDSDNPDVYIDGKKYDLSIVELLDKDKIASIDVLKGEKALKEYNAPNGVILIKTKSKNPDPVKFRFREGANNETEPLIIIDGIPTSKANMGKLDPIDIDSINVLKGEEAMKKYNAKGGVIIVTTKTAANLKKKKE